MCKGKYSAWYTGCMYIPIPICAGMRMSKTAKKVWEGDRGRDKLIYQGQPSHQEEQYGTRFVDLAYLDERCSFKQENNA